MFMREGIVVRGQKAKTWGDIGAGARGESIDAACDALVYFCLPFLVGVILGRRGN